MRDVSDLKFISFSKCDVGCTVKVFGNSDVSSRCSFVVEATAVFFLASEICAFWSLIPSESVCHWEVLVLQELFFFAASKESFVFMECLPLGGLGLTGVVLLCC